MSQGPHHPWGCQVCFQQFPTKNELRNHIEVFESRVRHLIAELQRCLAHSGPDVPPDEDLDDSDDGIDGFVEPIDQSSKEKSDTNRNLLCPHQECEGKPRTRFQKWKNLVRHYTIHVECNYNCVFCGSRISRVRQYVTHYDSCRVRKLQENLSPHKRDLAIRRRRSLNKMASRALSLKMSTSTGTEHEEALSRKQSRLGEHTARKRPYKMIHTDSDTFRHSTEQHHTIQNYTGFSASSSSELSYPPAPGHAIGSNTVEASTPLTNVHMNNLASTAPTERVLHRDPSQPSELTIIHGDLSTDDAELLVYAINQDATLRDSTTRAPLLTAHTMDGCSIEQHQNGALARAPVLLSQTIDGHPDYLAPGTQDAGVYPRAPVLSSHTIDGSTYQYAMPARNDGIMLGYNVACVSQNNTQIAGDMSMVTYGGLHPSLFGPN
ncbi:hypothetical protein CLAIMM_03126 isoform 4 [Cladophialophora immunda]|nr:hypothetical protein CLAIMM_03126 isoform 4 [Cladophialophora immunda]